MVLGMCRRPVAIGYIVDRFAMENPGRLELVGKGVYADNTDESRLVTRISVAPESEVKVMAGRYTVKTLWSVIELGLGLGLGLGSGLGS